MIDQISSDLKAAMIAHDALRVGVLRMLRSEIKNQEIALGSGAQLNDEQILNVIRKEVKKRTDAATAYAQVGSTERAELETSEATLLRAYLPAGPTEEVILAFLQKTLAEHADSAENQKKGLLIRAAREEFGQSADGGTVAKLVDQILRG
jgi:uncharacterized protein